MTEQTGRKQQVAEKRANRSKGYLVVDSLKCSGCQTCMMACSMVNEGTTNTALSRIQITQDPFKGFPADIQINICLQCVFAPCVESCPIDGAFVLDAENGFVRTIVEDKCTGCQLCIKACPHMPNRILFNPESNKVVKCDLCASAKYKATPGGVEGSQACIENCPMKAIKFETKTPVQQDHRGYEVNLRNEHWSYLGFPTE